MALANEILINGRDRLRLLGGLAAMAILPTAARAATAWPTRPVTVIAPSGAGGATDIAARLVAQHLARDLGQPFVVENKAGAAGMIAMQQLVRSEPDGYTIAIASNSPLTTSPLIYKSPGYDPVESFAPVGLFTTSAHALLVAPESGINSVKDLVARGKDKPDALAYSTAGVNGSIHLLTVLFTSSAGFQALHVPYKGGSDTPTALMSGQVTFAFDAITTVAGLLKAGKLKALAVSAPRRDPALPDVPTMTELGYPDVTTQNFYGVIAPAKTPRPVLAVLSDSLKKIATDEGFRAAIVRTGSNPAYMGPDEFGQYVALEVRRWKGVIQKMGVVPQ